MPEGYAASSGTQISSDRVERAEGCLLGFCALREIAGTTEVEIIYGLAPAAWGQGLATEAAQAVVKHGFETIGLARIWGRTDPPNSASLRVIERLQMRPAENPGHETTPIVAFVLDRRA
jgi:RimJ/RimL family protein N-acetyltransferase